MNERIFEFLNEASASAPLGDSTWENEMNFIGKFAELIIKECANIADKAEPYKANDLILKHFGIK